MGSAISRRDGTTTLEVSYATEPGLRPDEFVDLLGTAIALKDFQSVSRSRKMPTPLAVAHRFANGAEDGFANAPSIEEVTL